MSLHPFRGKRFALRTKLVAAALALVAAALVVIGVTSTVLLRQNLINRIDKQLQAAAAAATFLSYNGGGDIGVAKDWFVWTANPQGVGSKAKYDETRYTAKDLPPLPTGLSEIAKVAEQPRTVVTASGVRWRLLVHVLPGNSILYVAEDLTSVDDVMGRFVISELLVGGSVLILLGVAAAGMVRYSLRPLVEIEQTAEAIASGDLTRRVPDVEPGVAHPQTEVGRLARALNAMLGQIETAFTARANSEQAARQAESSARQAAGQAQVAELRARRSEERMRQFVADASHELRTPLTTIRGFAELYRQGAAREPEQVENLVRRIEDEAARMGLLVEDLLLLARMDEERPITKSPVELRVLAVDAVSAARAVAPDRDVSLEVTPDLGPLTVLGDEPRLRQVIGNLMTNALTHTPSGTPVQVRLSGSDTEAVIEVADAGPGLSAEQRERVFERFYRVDTARTRRARQLTGEVSGTGLGLAIVAALVAAHGGHVDVESAPGAGATFRVVLPRDTSEESPDLVPLLHS